MLPRRRHDLAVNVAEMVEAELFSVGEIQGVVRDIAEGERVRSFLRERIDSLVAAQLERLNPMVRGFVVRGLVDSLKTKLEEELVAMLGGLADELHHGIEEHVDVRDMVRRRIEDLDMAKVEAIVFRIARRELRLIELLGGVLGFVVGAAEAALLMLLA